LTWNQALEAGGVLVGDGRRSSSTSSSSPRTDGAMAATRRSALKLLLATGGLLPVEGGCQRVTNPNNSGTKAATMTMDQTKDSPTTQTMPVIFLAHGSPLLLDDEGWVAELARWAHAMPRPRAVLMLSAHWEKRPVTLGATRSVPLVYDFYGFTEKYYRVKYPAPGATELADRVRTLLGRSQPVADDPERGLDHGAYVPLVAMYPGADVPVLQASLPSMDPSTLFALGRALAPLRREGVLIVGSGFLTHNLRTFRFGADAVTPAWAADFDAWAADTIGRRDVDALLDYRQRAPGVREALPTHEHFVPVVVAMGASIDRDDRIAFPITGFMAGTFTRRSVQFG
jgi:4,5-DOPA dioxygenase extradiol